jgi:hypothetical protein
LCHKSLRELIMRYAAGAFNGEEANVSKELSLPLLPPYPSTDGPNTSVAGAAASVATKRKSRCTFIGTSPGASPVLFQVLVVGILCQKRER